MTEEAEASTRSSSDELKMSGEEVRRESVKLEYMYADDTVIYYASSDSKVIENTINKEISKIAGWFQGNLLLLNLNEGKTEFVLFETTQRFERRAWSKNNNQ